MSWMVMHDGQEVSMAYPRAGDISAARIAHNLSMVNRFVGAANRPYSVAEHSLLVVDILEQHFALCVHGLFAGLMHDGHECVTNDQTTPSKREIGTAWDIFEGKFEAIVSATLNFRTAKLRYAREIHTADLMALAIERAQLLPQMQPDGQPSTPWPILARVPVLEGYDLNAPWRVQRTWQGWRDAFIARFVQLDNARRSSAMTPIHALSNLAGAAS